MKNQFAKIVAVLMVLAMAVSVFGLCASAAETTTEAQVAILGDVNFDGKVTIQDATLIQKAIAKLATLDEAQVEVADAYEDGNVNVKDATAIQKWIAKFEDANENIGKPMATADEATKDEATEDQATVDEATKDEATADEATKDEATKDEATADEPAKFYTVAGAEGLCGVNWDPAQNVMTDDGDGTWSITFTGIAAGTYEFKVVENGAWGNPDFNLEGNAANGGANAKVEVLVDNATVIIGFDGEKAIVEFVTAPATQDEATKDEEKPVEPATKDEPVVDPATEDEATADEAAFYLVGWINNADVYDTTYAFVNGTVTVEFTADSYVAVQDENGTVFWTDGWLDFNPTSAVLGEFGANNNKFHVAAGTVTFTWDAATCTLAVA